jgi:hypothetical protein
MMHDVEYDKKDGDRYLKIHDHPELFKHFVLPVVKVNGILFYITRNELKDDLGKYSFADVPGHFGAGDYSYGRAAFFVPTVGSFWDDLFKRTFNDRCDAAVKRLEEICFVIDAEPECFHRDYAHTVDFVKRWRIKKLSINMQLKED